MEFRYRIAVRGIVKHEGKFLLLKRAKLARGENGFWELPGGGQDFGESPEEALIRELDEETGLTVTIENPVCVWHHLRENNVQIIGMTYTCKAITTEVVLSDEHSEYAWVTKEELDAYKVFPELINELEKIEF
jgi:8-oxo-dGTP diphosphatase